MTTQNHYNTFSAAASVAPIVLWSTNGSQGTGNVYAAAKNTFLEFYTDEKKAIKRRAAARSASCDSSFTAERSSVKSTNAPTTRSPSPSNHSLESSCGNQMQSPDTTPRSKAQANGQYYDAQYYYDASCHDQYRDGSYQQHYDGNYDCSYENYEGAYQTDGGYPMMMPVMMSTTNMMPCFEQPEPAERLLASHNMMQQEPQVVRPRTKAELMFAKKQDLRELNTEPVDEITTLMVRGIPCSFSQDTLMKTIDNAGLQGKYDFFYLPRAGNNGSNLGYAFINFTDQAGAEQCMATFNGLPLDPSRSTKVCTISQADLQGLANLRKHFRRTAVSRGSRGPVFLKVFNDEEAQV